MRDIFGRVIRTLDWKIDTYEKAMNVLDARDISRHANKKIEYLLGIYPEISKCSHQRIADILGLQRETVSRNKGCIKGR